MTPPSGNVKSNDPNRSKNGRFKKKAGQSKPKQEKQKLQTVVGRVFGFAGSVVGTSALAGRRILRTCGRRPDREEGNAKLDPVKVIQKMKIDDKKTEEARTYITSRLTVLAQEQALLCLADPQQVDKS